MSVTVEMNFDLKRINFDFSKELNKMGEMIKRDHYQRLEIGKDANTGNMEKLKKSTVRRKGHSKILVDTGQMRNLNIKKATKGNQVVELFPGNIRRYKGTSVTMMDVGGFHQDGNTNLPKREWFGISEDAKQRTERIMEERIEQEIRRA